MNIYRIESSAIKMMDGVVDPMVEWHKGGSDIRRILMKAIKAAYMAGGIAECRARKQLICDHAFSYTRTGGKCKKCGVHTLKCSSD